MNSNPESLVITRKCLYCPECGDPYDGTTSRILNLGCGHDICQKCNDESAVSNFCMFCKSSNTEVIEKRSSNHNELVIQLNKERQNTPKKKVPRDTNCQRCQKRFKENELTICHTCSKWKTGDSTDEISDFADRPVSALLCFECSSIGHRDHEVMNKDMVDRIWSLPEATEGIKFLLNKTNILMSWLSDGGVKRLGESVESMNEKLEKLNKMVNEGKFSLIASPEVLKGMKNMSATLRYFGLYTRNYVTNTRRMEEYLDNLLEFMNETSQKVNAFEEDKNKNKIDEMEKRFEPHAIINHSNRLKKMISDSKSQEEPDRNENSNEEVEMNARPNQKRTYNRRKVNPNNEKTEGRPVRGCTRKLQKDMKDSSDNLSPEILDTGNTGESPDTTNQETEFVPPSKKKKSKRIENDEINKDLTPETPSTDQNAPYGFPTTPSPSSQVPNYPMTPTMGSQGFPGVYPDPTAPGGIMNNYNPYTPTNEIGGSPNEQTYYPLQNFNNN